MGSRTRFANEEAIKSKEMKYGDLLSPTYKCIPLVFSACGDSSSSVRDLGNELGKLAAEADDN